jgi:hypothetical protein
MLALNLDFSKRGMSNCTPGFPTPMACKYKQHSATVVIAMQQHHHRSTFVALLASCNHIEEIYETLQWPFARWGCPACFPRPCCSGRFLAAAQCFAQLCTLGAIPPARQAKLRCCRNGKRKQLAKNCTSGANPRCPWNYPAVHMPGQ